MTTRIPRATTTILNRLGWVKTEECHRYEVVDGQKIDVPRAEGPVWFASTGYDSGIELSDTIKRAAHIKAQPDFVGNSFGVSFPLSELPALAANGVTFAKKALQDPNLGRTEPAPRWRV